MKKNKTVKIMAIFALFWIIIWVVWTGILILTSPKVETEKNENVYKINNNNISEEEMKKIIDKSKVKINTFTWTTKK